MEQWNNFHQVVFTAWHSPEEFERISSMKSKIVALWMPKGLKDRTQNQ